MNYTEEAITFACEGHTLLGIVTRPEVPAQVGLVVIVGGPQYRVGSHRQFVQLARSAAQAGYAVLRFDYRGMGDSTGEQRDFLAVESDIAAAIDALCATAPSVQRVALWGLCDGASAALLYCGATGDARVQGLCLLNPWVRSEASLAKTHVKHYYTRRLMQKAFWAKLLRGRVALGALTSLWRNLAVAFSPVAANAGASRLPFQARMAAAWLSFEGPVLLLLSSEDYTAKEFLEHVGSNAAWAMALQKSTLMLHHVPDADHTFSDSRLIPVIGNCTVRLLESMTPPCKQQVER
jgi:exosortase A-associated hydrolase 1